MEDDANTGAAKPPRLLEQLRDAIQRRHYSSRTEETYVHWVKRFIYFSGRRHPRELGAPEVTAFLNYLAREREVAAATQNQALSALIFLYKEVLAQSLPWLEDLERAKRPARLPNVLTRDEVQRLLARMQGSEVADGEPALRRWPAPARVPEAARQGRGLRVPADSRAGRQRRQGPRHHAAAIGDRAAPGTLSSCKDSARAGSRRGLWRRGAARCACAQVSEGAV